MLMSQTKSVTTQKRPGVSMFRRTALVALLAAAGLAGAACDDTGWARRTPTDRVEFAVMPSRTELLVGETATFTVRSANVLGQEPRVEWSTNGGTLTTEEENRVARVTFDKAGTYLVEAKLFLKEQLARTDVRTIKVRPVP